MSAADGSGAGTTASPEPAGLRATFDYDWPLDLRRTLRPIQHSVYDPTIRFVAGAAWMTRRTAEGAATILLESRVRPDGGATVTAEAWGPGAAVALDAVPSLVGAFDRPEALDAVLTAVPAHPLVHELTRRFPGFRMTRTGQLLPALVPAVLGQKITADEMIRAYVRLLRRLG